MKKTGKLKRIIYLFVACAICISMVTNSIGAVSIDSISKTNAVVTVDDAESLVINGGFETGTFHAWSVEPGHDDSTVTAWNNAVSIVSDEKHSGNYAAKIVKSSEDGFYGYQTVVYSPEVGKDYTISYWAKTTDTAKVATCFLAQGDESTQWETYAQLWNNGEEHFITASGDWEQRSFTFSVPANSDIKMISIRLMVYGAGTAYVDDFVLTPKTATAGENLFCNGSFDGGSCNGWAMEASTEIPPKMEEYDAFNNGTFEENTNAWALNSDVWTTDEAHTGTHSLKLEGESWNYGASMTPGLEYTYTAFIKVTGAEDGFTVYPYIWNFGDTWLNAESMRISANCDWTKVSYTFTAPTPDATNGVRLGFVKSGTGNAYIDDISLIHKELKPLTKTTELLVNNNFANGKTNWIFSGNCEIVDDDGVNEIKMTVPANGSEYIQQTVSVVPGKTYDFSADLMTQEQDGNDAQAQVYVIDSEWKMVCPSEFKTYGWKHLAATYTAPAGVTSVTVLLQHNVVAGVSFWKNISFSITETVTEEKRVNVFVNGDFETIFSSNSSYAYNINDAVAEFTTDNVHSGTYAIKYTSGYFTNYETSVEPGTYTLSMWVNTVSGDTAEISGFVSGCGIPWKDFAMTSVRGVTNGWVQISGEVTFTEAGKPQFGFKSYDGSGEVYIDDIKLEKVTYEPVYPSSTYTEGIGMFGGDNGMLKADTKTEWWNYGTAVTEGQKYVYSMDVKVENAQSGFHFYPYIMNFGASWLQDTVYYADTDWTHYEFEFTAAAPDASNGTRFGFARSGVGTVYIDNIKLNIVPDEPVPVITSENENLVENRIIAVEKDSTASVSIDGIKKDKEYILKFNVVCWSDKDTDKISAKLGTAGFENLVITQEDSFVAVTAVITANESGTVDFVLGSNDLAAVFSDIELYRQYTLGDVNGDDQINILDIVKYKKYFANKGDLATYIYADMDNNGILDACDLTELLEVIIAA